MGRAIGVGALCAVAATIGLWSGPLAAASGALHSNVSAPHVSALHVSAPKVSAPHLSAQPTHTAARPTG